MKAFDEAFFRFEGEPGIDYKAAFIHYQDAFWLVATWWQPLAGGAKTPDRIIPLAQFQPQWLGQVTPMYRLDRPIPRRLFADNIPPEMAEIWKVQTFPYIAHIQERGQSH